MTKRIGILYFSPTNTTKKICRAVALGMGAKPADAGHDFSRYPSGNNR
ncbi:MAG: hypothetical protein C5S48_06365 [Candidatus Methanogaster sp.]|nr:MAG: hypothetical protein C5S48_06365 [ANME-2 cluster archaeon]